MAPQTLHKTKLNSSSIINNSIYTLVILSRIYKTFSNSRFLSSLKIYEGRWEAISIQWVGRSGESHEVCRKEIFQYLHQCLTTFHSRKHILTTLCFGSYLTISAIEVLVTVNPYGTENVSSLQVYNFNSLYLFSCICSFSLSIASLILLLNADGYYSTVIAFHLSCLNNF